MHVGQCLLKRQIAVDEDLVEQGLLRLQRSVHGGPWSIPATWAWRI